MPNLPLVLAGPILKNCSASEIFVWIALSQDIYSDPNQTIELEVYRCEQKALPTKEEMTAGRRCTKAIGASYEKKDIEKLPTSHIVTSAPEKGNGVVHLSAAENLHVYLIRARPFQKQFEIGEILAYEVYVAEIVPTTGKETLWHRYGFCEHLQDSLSLKGRKEPIYKRGYSDDPNFVSTIATTNDVLLEFSADQRPNPLLPKNYSDTKNTRYQYPLPTFLLQGEDDLKVWAGSCFKLHGDGISATTLMFNRESKKLEDAGLLPNT
jgi:hypothetical protein